MKPPHHRVFRYRQLARDIEQKIRVGIYKPGEKLPSIRALHRRLSVSISTVYKAFIELEAMGMIEARPRSGYYVAPVSLRQIKAPQIRKSVHPPQKVRLSSMINSVVSALNDPKLLPLGSTVVDAALLPAGRIVRSMKGIPRRKVRSLLSYTFSEGYPELRRQVIRQSLGVLEGQSVEDVIITNGCMEAVALALAATTLPGDTVAIETPTNFSFLQLLRELTRKIVEVPTDPVDGIDLDEFENILGLNAIRACLFMPNFHNPLGAVMPDEKKARLVELLSRHQIPVIEDDISSELHFEGQRPRPLKAFDKSDIVLTCSSFSKTLAPGFRIGWIVPGKRYLDKIQQLKAVTNIATSTLDQYLIAGFLDSGAYQRHLRSLRSILRKQAIKTALAVQAHFPLHTRLAVPKGGSLMWVELPPGVDGLTVYRQALSRNISLIPGVVCSSSNRYDHHIQISFGLPYTKEVEEGIETLGAIVGSL